MATPHYSQQKMCDETFQVEQVQTIFFTQLIYRETPFPYEQTLGKSDEKKTAFKWAETSKQTQSRGGRPSALTG